MRLAAQPIADHVPLFDSSAVRTLLTSEPSLPPAHLRSWNSKCSHSSEVCTHGHVQTVRPRIACSVVICCIYSWDSSNRTILNEDKASKWRVAVLTNVMFSMLSAFPIDKSCSDRIA
jgi:hypothetical protein